MDLSPYRLEETVNIDASPEAVYDLIADVTRIGEWSPVCTSAAWDGDDQVWFSGTNTSGDRTWTTKCRVDTAERGKEFTFVNCGMAGDAELVRWSYTFEATEGGTAVTEHWEVLDGYPGFMEAIAPGMDVGQYLDGVKPNTLDSIRQTLANLKSTAEA